MDGIMFLSDEKNENRFVQIDLNKYGEIWEDFYDGLMAEMAKGEPTISIEELGQQLKSKGLLDEV